MRSAGLVRSDPQVIKRAIQARLADHHHAVAGQVVAYNASTNLADVQVLVEMPVFDDDGRITTYEDLGVLASVPVKQLRAGGFVLTFPLQKGDTGELLFHDRSLGEWRATNQKSKPVDVSRHSIGWATFKPDLFSDANPLNAGDLSNRQAGILLGKEGSSEQILIQSGRIQAGASGVQPIALKSDLAGVVSALVTCASALGSATTIANVAAAGSALNTALTTVDAPVYSTLFETK